MTVMISDDMYKEYMVLQHSAIYQQKIASAKGMINLKSDIDVPMLNLVSMFALLGCEPIWSCCGFDYDGQPLHKTHEYGNSYVVLRDNENTKAVIEQLISVGTIKSKKDISTNETDTNEWETWTIKGFVYLRTDFDNYYEKIQYPWNNKSCIHYSELAHIKIKKLEKVLFKGKDKFLNDVTLHDSNSMQKRNLPNWQYPALEDWTINKDEFIESYIGEHK